MISRARSGVAIKTLYPTHQKIMAAALRAYSQESNGQGREKWQGLTTNTREKYCIYNGYVFSDAIKFTRESSHVGGVRYTKQPLPRSRNNLETYFLKLFSKYPKNPLTRISFPSIMAFVSFAGQAKHLNKKATKAGQYESKRVGKRHKKC